MDKNKVLEWEIVPLTEGCFSCTPEGIVRGNDRYINHPLVGRKHVREKILKHQVDPYGYHLVSISMNGVRKKTFVHRIVALTFIPNPQQKPFINHKDGNKSNNSVDNLEWCTHSENTLHAFANGLMVAKKGEKNHSAKLSDKQVEEIKKLLLQGKTQYSIAKKFSVHKVTIFDIKHGKTWAHL